MSTSRSPASVGDASRETPRDSLARRFGAVIWPSFFAAGVATIVFFAIVDPVELATITWPDVEITRLAGYSIGFFMFWLCTLSACLFTAVLIAPPLPPRQQPAHRDGRG
ncbi:MAG TPA: hypothetical protein PK021_06540 [Dokdonella sp.]|nr:hypothetical protein [Dokdonella sp.]HQX64914.1 hypothetical protein [Dokdonella sp.]HQZ62047.1 hypothetical protein [Dokdonella sp.]